MNKFSIKALAYACHAAIWFVVVATVAAERHTQVKDFLAGLTGHHWTAKGIIALILFFAVAFIFSKKPESENVTGTVSAVIVSAGLGAITIFAFYMLHFLGLA